MIKGKLSFFLNFKFRRPLFPGNKFTILFFGSVNFPVSQSYLQNFILLKSVEYINSLYIFKCTMLKTLNSDFLD